MLITNALPYVVMILAFRFLSQRYGPKQQFDN